jgi:hypothetical protein
MHKVEEEEEKENEELVPQESQQTICDLISGHETRGFHSPDDSTDILLGSDSVSPVGRSIRFRKT